MMNSNCSEGEQAKYIPHLHDRGSWKVEKGSVAYNAYSDHSTENSELEFNYCWIIDKWNFT